MQAYEHQLKLLLSHLLGCTPGKTGTLLRIFLALGNTRRRGTEPTLQNLLPDIFLHLVPGEAPSSMSTEALLRQLQPCLLPEQLAGLRSRPPAFYASAFFSRFRLFACFRLLSTRPPSCTREAQTSVSKPCTLRSDLDKCSTYKLRAKRLLAFLLGLKTGSNQNKESGQRGTLYSLYIALVSSETASKARRHLLPDVFFHLVSQFCPGFDSLLTGQRIEETSRLVDPQRRQAAEHKQDSTPQCCQRILTPRGWR